MNFHIIGDDKKQCASAVLDIERDGHKCVQDWTKLSETKSGYEKHAAIRMAKSCSEAAVVLCFWTGLGEDSLIQLGVALGKGRRCVVIGVPVGGHHTILLHHPLVAVVPDLVSARFLLKGMEWPRDEDFR